MLFEEAFEKYLIYAEKRHKKQGFIIIRQDFKNHILPYFKNSNINEISKQDILNWQNIIISKNFSNKYNALLYSHFNSFIKYCILCDYIKENILTQVGAFKKKIENKEHNVYNIWEFRKFRFYLNDFTIKQFFNFMYFYGTRPSEAMALRFCDLEGKYVNIRHSIHRKGKRELDTPKNQSSIRKIKINILMRIRIWLLKKSYANCNSEYFIFGGKKPLAPTTIDRYKKEAYEKAKLKPITQHEFRHSYATRLINKGKSINKVSKSLGHCRLSTTLDIYTH